MSKNNRDRDMGKAIVLYTSRRGSTKQYAEWIAEDLGCEAVPLDEAGKLDLYEYECIVYGGWIRGSGIVGFDKLSKSLDGELLGRLIVYGTGLADETPENYMQVWGFSIGRLDPQNEHKAVLYILGGRYDPAAVTGFDRILMKIMRRVLLSGSTPDARMQADKVRERIDNGVDLVRRENIDSLVRDARSKLQ